MTSIDRWATSVYESDAFTRAERTFVQAFIAQALAVQGASGRTVMVSAIAAGLSALWNAFISPWLDKRREARKRKRGLTPLS